MLERVLRLKPLNGNASGANQDEGFTGRCRMDPLERRRHRRLGAVYNISCRKMGPGGGESYEGCTMDVSSGGSYFETRADVFKAGDLLRVELSIQPTPGLLEFGGKIAGFAKVLRASNITDSGAETGLSADRYGVAVQFCRPPRLCT